jgi:uncharacterized protein YecE (DUF72 family)
VDGLILIGGRFYPIEIAKKKVAWFDYHAQFFKTGEINSTFYQPPGERQLNSWINKSKKDFEYSLKVPQIVTHKALVSDRAEWVFWAISFERTCVKPLVDAGLLGGVFFSSPPTSRTKALLRQLKECVRCCFSSGDQLSGGVQAQ